MLTLLHVALIEHRHFTGTPTLRRHAKSAGQRKWAKLNMFARQKAKALCCSLDQMDGPVRQWSVRQHSHSRLLSNKQWSLSKTVEATLPRFGSISHRAVLLLAMLRK